MTEKLSRWRRSAGSPPLVLGHRGARHAAPENTFAAFDLALEEGADGLELDVRPDGSGELVVLHDRDLLRVTAGRDPRKIEDLTEAERREVRLTDNQRIPLLEEVLDWAVRRNQRVNVELKRDVSSHARVLRRLSELLRRMRAPADHVLVSSFDPTLALRFRLSEPNIPVAWLVHSGQKLVQSAPLYRQAGFDGVHPEWRLVTAERISRWKRQGGVVNVWTVNDVAEATRLASLGVDALISDTPGALKRALG